MAIEHYARRLRSLACGVADVKALHPKFGQIIRRNVQRVHQRAGTSLLATLFSQQAGQLNISIFLRHFQPNAPLLARVVHGANFDAGLLRQQRNQIWVYLLAYQQRGRWRCVNIVLRDKGL